MDSEYTTTKRRKRVSIEDASRNGIGWHGHFPAAGVAIEKTGVVKGVRVAQPRAMGKVTLFFHLSRLSRKNTTNFRNGLRNDRFVMTRSIHACILNATGGHKQKPQWNRTEPS